MERSRIRRVVGVAAITLLGQITARVTAGLESSTAVDAVRTWPGMSQIRIARFEDAIAAAQPIQPVEADGSLECFDGCTGCSSCYAPSANPKYHPWVSGVEATFLQPNIGGRDSQYLIFDPVGTPIATVPRVDAEELTASPRVWLGWQGKQWGVMFRFWSLNHSELGYLPFGTTVGSMAFGRLDVYTIDLEATNKFCICGHNMVGTIGVRYAEFDHQQFTSGFNVVGPDLFSGTTVTEHYLGSTGPTFSLNGCRPIKWGKWNVFWNVRGSVLFGETRRVAETSAQAANIFASAGSIDNAIAAADETLYIAECQLGLQRDYRLKCLPACAFFRIGFEYQYWDADSASVANSTSGATLGADTVVTTASASDIRMDLIGFAIATGFHW